MNSSHRLPFRTARYPLSQALAAGLAKTGFVGCFVLSVRCPLHSFIISRTHAPNKLFPIRTFARSTLSNTLYTPFPQPLSNNGRSSPSFAVFRCTDLSYPQAQTPQQRKANEKFAKREETKRGKPDPALAKAKKFKSPVSPIWLSMCLLVLGGPCMIHDS